jgi:histidinol dehydrogenase
MQKGLNLKVWDSKKLPKGWFKRAAALDVKETVELENKVRTIISQVREGKDQALFKAALDFDSAKLDAKTVKVKPEEIKASYKKVKEEQVAALKLIKERLEFREKQIVERERKQQLTTIQNGITVQSVLCPIESVGCYVPGGLATYPSSLIMTATPAKVAGASRIVVCSPVRGEKPIDPLILVAADICGVDEIYKVGGAQAIAALAYGTQSIQPVKKIVGPGNKYVMMAKMVVSQDVAIDMPAGPSEVLVLADDTADSKAIAADMISQAEHTPNSTSGLITTSQKIAQQVIACIASMAEKADRKEIVKESLSNFGFVLTCKTVEEMVKLANVFAPEHLEIMTSKPKEIADKITSAGLILLGAYTPVALSDYGSGTNHVLPTGGFAQSFSGLSVFDFMRRVSIVESSKAGLEKAAESIRTLTAAENLPNHYKAVEARFKP